MCRSIVEKQSVAAEIRRGKKVEEEEERKKPQGKNIMACPITQGGHNYDEWEVVHGLSNEPSTKVLRLP